MDSLLILLLIFFGSCLTVMFVMVIVNWIVNKYVRRPNGDASSSHSAPLNDMNNSDSRHISIPIMEAITKTPTSSNEIASTCIVFMPAYSSSIVDHNYAFAMKKLNPPE